MKYNRLKKSLEKAIAPIYLLTGDDLYLKDTAKKSIAAAAGVTNPEFNVADLADDPLIADITAAAEQCPLMSERRIVSVRLTRSKLAAAEKAAWKSYVENSNPQTVLILSLSAAGDLNAEGVEVVECDRLEDTEISTWIRERAQSGGKTISDKEIFTLINSTHGNMLTISGEMEKLMLYCEGEITAEAVALLVSKSEEFEVYEIANRIGRKDAKGAIDALNRLLSRGEEPTVLLSILYSTMRRMLYVLLNKDTDNERLASFFGVKPYAVNKLRESAAGFSAARLLKAISLCLDADIDLKSVSSNKADRLILLILTLVSL